MTPPIISREAVPSIVMGFAWNNVTNLFYTLSETITGSFTIDAYNGLGVRTGSTNIYSHVMQPLNLLVVL